MKRKNKGHKSSKKIKYLSSTIGEEIIVTDHVIMRHKLRNKKNNITDPEAKRAIIQQVKQSFLIKSKDGIEKRTYYGNLYICKRIKGDGIIQDRLIVITEELSKIRQKERFSSNFTNINYAEFDHKLTSA
ncbi:hypothetical protein [Vallitalea guaymasensis]|uniref:hypothetical protein n=1 Tax=Vallitalea guaymasensis TaxID=1185412 RepID=UPI000DE521C0|nr:hypothetical protein [Vallitalea guaymasensis]